MSRISIACLRDRQAFARSAESPRTGSSAARAWSAYASDATLVARPLQRHPSVVRDVSILVDDTLSAETVRGTIRAALHESQGALSPSGASPLMLVEVREFDRYQGKGIPEGKVSLSHRLTFQASDRTLTDAEVQAAMQAIVTALNQNLNAIQR